jgi:hypothetical protein
MGLQGDGGNAYLPGWPETPGSYNRVFFAVKKKLLQTKALTRILNSFSSLKRRARRSSLSVAIPLP